MAAEEGLIVRFTGEASSLVDAAKVSTQSLQQLQDKYAHFADALSKAQNPQAITNLSNYLKNIGQQITDLGGSVPQQIDKINKGIEKTGATSMQARYAVTDLSHVFRDLPYAINNPAILAGPFDRMVQAITTAKQQGQSFGGVLSSLVTGSGGILLGFSVLTTAISLFGDKLLDLMSGTDDASGRIKEMADVVAGTKDEYTKAVQNVDMLRDHVELAKQGFISKKEVVNEYNKTLGETIGKVTTLDQVETALNSKADAYIEFTLKKAAANVALSKAAEQAFLIAQKNAVGPTTQELVSGSDKTSLAEAAKKTDEFIALKKKADAAFLTGDKPAYQKYFEEEDQFIKDFVNGKVNKDLLDEQHKFEDIGKDFNKDAALLAQKYNFDFFGGKFGDKAGKPAFDFFGKMFDFDPARVQQGSKKFFEAFNTASEFALKNFHLFQGLDKIIEAPNKEASYKAALDWWKGYQEGIILLKPPRIDIRPEDFPKIISPEDITKTYTDAMSNPFKTPENLGIIDPDSIKRSDIIFKYQNLFKQIGKQMPSIFDFTDDQGRRDMNTALSKIPTNELGNTLSTTLANSKTQMQDLAKTVSGVVTPAFQNMFKAIEAGKPPLQAFFQGIEQSIEQLIEKLIAAAIEAAVLSALSGGGTSFIAAFGNISGLSISKHAAGGLAYGPSLGMIGEYANAGSNPEVIAPLSKLKGMLGGGIGGGGGIVGVLRGTDIVLLNSRIAKKQSRTS